MSALSFVGQRVGVYARFSSLHQREASIEDQVHECRRFIQRNGGTFDPERVFSDAAVSGRMRSRAGFDALIASTRGNTRSLDVIVTESWDRVSRDLGDSVSLLKLLQFEGVRLIGISDGIDTGAKNAKTMVFIQGFFADNFIDALSEKTRRGLEGRARAGFSTGGLPYGYRSKPSLGPDGRVVGHEIIIDPDAASTIVRIFELYLSGQSYPTIAGTLNAERLPPPRTRSAERQQGWVGSTVRAMLYNDAYAGRWKYRAKEWRRDPETRRRRYRTRPADEIIHQERPHLRIVPPELWDQVQGRLRATLTRYTRALDGTAKGRARPGRPGGYLLSGLLVCGACGAPMVVCGGSSATYMRCSAHSKRRTCTNALSIREDTARTGILSGLRERLQSRASIAYARKRFAELQGEAARTQTADVSERSDRLARVEARISNLVKFIAEGDHSDGVRTMLRDFEIQANSERKAITSLRSMGASPVRLPSPDEVREQVFNLDRILSEDVPRGRELLRRLFRDGNIRLHPQEDRSYVARSEVLPLVLLAEMTTPRNRAGASVHNLSCAGRI